MGTRQREYNFQQVCEWCGEVFYSSRSDARFCKPAHRAKSHRAELKRSKQYERIKESIAALLSECPPETVDMMINDIQSYASRWSIKVIG